MNFKDLENAVIGETILIAKNEKLSPKEKLGQQLKETQEKLNIAIEALEFYDDVLSHHDKCNYPFHECRCMDRTIYNEENSIENARQALTKILTNNKGFKNGSN